MNRSGLALSIAAVLLVCVPLPAAAQGIGIGPRFSFIRGHLPSKTPAATFLGGALRLRASKRSAIELALDYKSVTNEDGSARVRETPIQGSLLIFPVRAAFSPYLLGGAGIYTRQSDQLDGTGRILATSSERRVGWHLGIGAEFFVNRRTAFFADYRFRFVKFGTPDYGSEVIDIPGSSLVPALGSLKLSHQGSMWTSGVAFYF